MVLTLEKQTRNQPETDVEDTEKRQRRLRIGKLFGKIVIPQIVRRVTRPESRGFHAIDSTRESQIPVNEFFTSGRHSVRNVALPLEPASKIIEKHQKAAAASTPLVIKRPPEVIKRYGIEYYTGNGTMGVDPKHRDKGLTPVGKPPVINRP